MNRYSFKFFALLLGSTSFCVTGCGPNAAPVPEVSTMAASAKSQVEKFVEMTTSAPEDAPQECELLLESFTAYATDYGPSFTACRDAIMELNLAYKGGSSESEISEKLAALTAAAAALK